MLVHSRPYKPSSRRHSETHLRLALLMKTLNGLRDRQTDSPAWHPTSSVTKLSGAISMTRPGATPLPLSEPLPTQHYRGPLFEAGSRVTPVPRGGVN